MIVINTGTISRHFEKHREKEIIFSKIQTCNSDIDKSMRAYKVLCLAKKLTKEYSCNNEITHEIDIHRANHEFIYIISKLETNKVKMGIKKSIELNGLALDNYMHLYEQKILAAIWFNENELINSNQKEPTSII